MAQPFDNRRLELSGEPVAVAEQLDTFLLSRSSLSRRNGVLIYRSGAGHDLSQLMAGLARQASGRRGPNRASMTPVALSPDGTRAAVTNTPKAISGW